jgi:hypothetical protein
MVMVGGFQNCDRVHLFYDARGVQNKARPLSGDCHMAIPVAANPLSSLIIKPLIKHKDIALKLLIELILARTDSD